jgi:hypothetical protein
MAPDPGKGLRQQQAGQAGTEFHPQVVRSQASADLHTGYNREEIPKYTHRLLSCFHFSQPAAGRSHADRPAAGLFFVIHGKMPPVKTPPDFALICFFTDIKIVLIFVDLPASSAH